MSVLPNFYKDWYQCSSADVARSSMLRLKAGSDILRLKLISLVQRVRAGQSKHCGRGFDASLDRRGKAELEHA